MAVSVGLLLMLELTGRLLPTPAPPLVLPAHPTRGWSLPVGQTFSFGGVQATTNSLGLRSPEPTADAPLRILTLGDSSVFGDGVADEETFSAVLAQRTGWDVQNGGVPGYTCAQSSDRYAELADVIQPDVLIIYSAHNDARVIRSDEAWMGAVEHPVGLLRLASLGATWVRIQRKIPRMSLREYRRCLSALLAAQAAAGGKSLLVTPVSKADFLKEDPLQRALIGPYFQVLAETAAATETPLLNLLDGRWSQGRHADALMLDPVHPNAVGHALIGKWMHAGLLTGGLVEGALPSDLPRPGTQNSPF